MEIIQIATFIMVFIITVSVALLLLRSRGGIRSKNPELLLDTSVLIDGRITTVAHTGFMTHTLLVPRSVVAELQLLADGSDHDKRERARHGLDVIKQLQEMPGVKTMILQDGPAPEGVDERLMQLAKKRGSAICTIDYNLNKVATVENITVLNVNDLARDLRMVYLPGESTTIELVQKGHDNHQAVGYLPDGTMVVVEQASRYVGMAKEVEFIRVLQTSAGKMMFARLSSAHARQTTSAHRSRVDAAQPKPKGRTPAKPTRSAKQHTAPAKPAAHRPKTSAQREASLISLVDQQTD